jgi:hypothetical protein
LGADTVVFRLEPSRSHEVPQGHFCADVEVVLMVDRYSAYKAMAQVNLGFDNLENSFNLEGKAVKSLPDFGGEASVEGFGIQSVDDLAVWIANAHSRYLLDNC